MNLRKPADYQLSVEWLWDEGLPSGDKTGWPSVDQHYTVAPGQLSIITGWPGAGKALALDTPIPTGSGWTTMGAIQIGDIVFDDRGLPTKVLRATDIMHGRPCYEMIFSDGARVVCDAEHQWVTRTRANYNSQQNASRNNRLLLRALAPRGTDQSAKRTHAQARTTTEIAESLFVQSLPRPNHAVALTLPLVCPHIELPIDPYTLGAWLGDGSSQHSGISDAEGHVVKMVANSYEVRKWSGRYAYGVQRLKPALRALNLLMNKHVPPQYLRAAEDQRLSLLMGLMDTDGYISETGHAEFTSTRKELAEGTLELILSLGMRAALTEGRAMLYGKDCGPKYRVHFTPLRQIFSLPRKAHRVNHNDTARRKWRYITSCRKVDSVPVRCIMVDAVSHQYLATRSFIPTHNSEWLDHLLVNLMRKHWKFAVFSAENRPVPLHMTKLLEKMCGKPFGAGPTPRLLKPEIAEFVDELDLAFRFIATDELVSLPSIIESAGPWLRDTDGRKPGLVIDPWNELEHLRPHGQSETEYVSQSLSLIRNWARTTGVHVWIVAHPAKQPRGDDGKLPRPTPDMISGSQHWWNKADCAICVYRNPSPAEDESRNTEIHIQKIRFKHIGKPGVVDLKYDRTTGRYHEPMSLYAVKVGE